MMDRENNARETIKLLVQHEKAIGRLYAAYAKFSDDKELWQQLANEEELHAKWIHSFYENLDDENLSFSDRFHPEILWQSIERIKNLIREAGSHTYEEMLQYALTIESMILEKDALRIFDNTPPAISEIILRLERGTSLHYAKILNKLNTLDVKHEA